MKKYVKDFSELPISLVYGFDEPEDQISILNKLFKDNLENHAPSRRVKLTRPIAPWMKDASIVSDRQKLEQSRIKSRDSNCPKDRNQYVEDKKKYKKCIKDKKKSFFRKALSSKNPKIVWNTIDRILNKQQKRIRHDPSEMNKYFTNLAANLTNRDNTESDIKSLLDSFPDQNGAESFHLNHTNYVEVHRIINNLKNDCSSGPDNIPVRYLKSVADHITSPLVHIINNSIDQEVFPKQWKISRVCPIPKNDISTSVQDFRPISVLSVLSKIYERVILNQLCTFIEKQNIYDVNQSGFRKGHSTNTLLLKLRDDIRKAMNKSEMTLSVLIDYSKAFDTIDHRILIEKLQELKFSKRAIKIMHSYLQDRQQYVQIEDKKSSLLPVFYGVPQGSILGPVLFNIYVAGLANRVYCKTIQYADDTTLYKHCKAPKLQECATAIEDDVHKLQSWSEENNLIFNCDKLQSILFSTSRLSSIHDLHNKSLLIRCSGKSIQQKSNVKLLGIIFDEHLNWINQVNQVIKSSYGTIRALRKFSRFTPMNVRKSLAEALILSRINYCNVVYGQLPKYMINRLQRIQNTTASYVYGRYATIIDVINLDWLPVEEKIEINVVKLAHKSLNDPLWPKYLKVNFVEQDRTLRSKDIGPLVRHGGNLTFQEQATSFNSLPRNLKIIDDFIKFSKEVKSYYKDKALARALSL